MNYKNKYKKYKNKYIQLKNIIGGAHRDYTIPVDNSPSMISTTFTKYECNNNVGFTNNFGTCWFIAILTIFLFSDHTSDTVQEVLYTKQYNYDLLTEYFTKLATDITIKSTINDLLNNIKNRLDNKISECNMYDPLESNEDKELARQQLRAQSKKCEHDLGTNIYNILKLINKNYLVLLLFIFGVLLDKLFF